MLKDEWIRLRERGRITLTDVESFKSKINSTEPWHDEVHFLYEMLHDKHDQAVAKVRVTGFQYEYYLHIPSPYPFYRVK